jgi:hypothetical protein
MNTIYKNFEEKSSYKCGFKESQCFGGNWYETYSEEHL